MGSFGFMEKTGSKPFVFGWHDKLISKFFQYPINISIVKFGRILRYDSMTKRLQTMLLIRRNGQNRIRTCEGKARRFTVFPRWPLGYLPENGARRTNHREF